MFKERLRRTVEFIPTEVGGFNQFVESEIGNNLTQIVDGNMEVRVGPGNAGTFSPSGADKNSEGIGTVASSMGELGVSEVGTGNMTISVERNKSQNIVENDYEVIGKAKTTSVGTDYNAYAKNTIYIEAGDEITLKCGISTFTMLADGTITLNGKRIFQVGDTLIELLSDMVKVN